MEQGLLGWPQGGTPGWRVQVDSFAVTGTGPYPLSATPNGGLVLGFFDGILQPDTNYLVSNSLRKVSIASGVATSDIQTFTVAYSVSVR